MVLFNYSTKEITAKIVYYGPGLCGKTTNLQFIYDNLPQTINKGKMLSLATKTDRTLFFDFLPIDLGTIRGMRTRLQLYTVPGQVFYNTTRKLVLKGADGVVFVADSQKRMIEANLESFGNLEENLAEHDMKLSDLPMIVQFNKRDLPDVATIEELNAAINKFNAPIYEAVAPTGIGVHETLKAITRLVLNSLKERYADKREQKADAKAKATAMMAAAANRPPGSGASVMTPTPAPASQSSVEPMRSKSPSTPMEQSPTPAPMPSYPQAETPLSQAFASMMSPEPAPHVGAAAPESLSFDLPEIDDVTGTEAPGFADEPFSAMSFEQKPESAKGTDTPAADLMSLETLELAGEEDLLEVLPEADLALDTGGEDLLELIDEPVASLVHLEDSMAMPLLDVTSEFSLEDNETAGSAPAPELPAIPVSRDTVMPADFVSPLLDTDATIEPDYSEVSLSEEPAGSVGLFDDSSFEPVAADAIVAEDHHDIPSSVEEFAALTESGPIPLAFEPTQTHSTASQPEYAPMASGIKDVSCAPALAREISVPVKLEILGQCISFELKISLDLAGAAIRAGAAQQDAQEPR